MRIQCKGCDYKPSQHDTLEGYCMICAGDKIRQIDQLQGELKRAREALKFYADETNYMSDTYIEDRGRRAKQALEGE